MIPEELVKSQGKEFNHRENRKDGVAVAASLANGFDILCDSFYLRVLQDVERILRGRVRGVLELEHVRGEEAAVASLAQRPTDLLVVEGPASRREVEVLAGGRRVRAAGVREPRTEVANDGCGVLAPAQRVPDV